MPEIDAEKNEQPTQQEQQQENGEVHSDHPAANGKAIGILEGMDPETGNYIRPPPGVIIPKIVEPQEDSEKDEDGHKARKKKLGSNYIPAQLDPNQLTTGSDGGKKLKRGWSKRVISTISNKSRQDEDEEEEDDGANNCIFGNQIRFTIMIISTLCLSSILSNILTFNFTFICMAGDKPENFSNMTEAQWLAAGYNPDLDYSSAQRSALFMAVAVGALLAVFPLTVALNKFGSRSVFGILGYVSAISTYLIPISANTGFVAMLIMRIIQGVGFSACLPVMGSITSHWSTLKQNGIFIAILSSFLQIAPIFTMPISGELCTSELGWPAVYYLHGTVSVVLFTLFILYHRNSPNKHPLMQRKEISKVLFGKGSIYSGPGRQKKSRKVPYAAMYRDKAIWAILVAAFGNFMGTQLSLQFMPTYINKVLFLPIEQTGMASAISPIIMFFIKLIAGQSSDRITFISDEMKLRIYNCLSMGLMGTFFIILALLDPVNQKSLCLVVLIMSTCILGFNSGGFFKSSQMVSRQHSHFTLANISFLNCVCMLLVPLLNEVIAPENTPETWAIVLWIHGIILLATNAFFCVLASAKPGSWTMDSWKHNDRGGAGRVKRNKIAPAPDVKQIDTTAPELH
ncbi:major facilitator superfamily domain-containing protein [Ditylenchus destructor]|uniref:Major facilitator superfamily domain-containing protein n=1 Tax=Ditylenchus destructor TaxID=166010 RepID=A0AAD4NBW5_9BILA|nr:major facilitator superfamily domain-containing protein [Ditylenchus destructor]